MSQPRTEPVFEHQWGAWVGRTQKDEDWITPHAVVKWNATLDRATAEVRNGDIAPNGIHWTLAQPVACESMLGADGHPRRGDASFLPPIPMPRRMWAGSRVSFHRPLRVGDRVTRESVISSITEKQGSTSALVFVTVHHRFTTDAGLALEEEQDLVYRPAPVEPVQQMPRATADADRAATRAPRWQRIVHPTETLLFRFSALTFNGHRIHYDRRFATEVERYPGLVVHAPLIATLLLDLLHEGVPSAEVERFTFRAVRPTFDTSDFIISANPAMNANHFELWSADNRGERAVEAEAWTR